MKWYWWVAISVICTALLVYFYYKSRQTEALQIIEEIVNEKRKPFTADDMKPALQKVKDTYGVDMARAIEKVARLETAHFTSKQYKLTGTGGMEAHGPAPYYGWYSPFFVKNPQYTPIGTTDMLENKGASEIGGNAQSKKPKSFVIMPSTEAWVMFLADYATRYKNSGGILRWYSTDKQAQAIYQNSLAAISSPITNSLT